VFVSSLEIFTAMKIQFLVFWVMTPCVNVVGNCFGGPCGLHLQGEVNSPFHIASLHSAITQKTTILCQLFLRICPYIFCAKDSSVF
jgi:hypothetical protein